jgi:PCFT/HCP family folate transporter-like MFS transporter 1/3
MIRTQLKSTSIDSCLLSQQNRSWWKSITIEPVVFLYMFAIYIAIPTDEALLYREICSKLYNISICNSMNVMKITQPNISKTMEDIIQKYTSISMIYLNLIYSIPSIFISMIYSIWSEKYSHKIPLILSNIGCILAMIVNLFVTIFRTNYSIEIFFLSNFFLSLFGSTSTMFTIIYNYLLHITTMANRTQHLAIIESCVMFGSTIGLILSGILLDLTNFQWNFFFILLIHLINILYIIFYVKEVIQMKDDILSWKNLFVWNEIRNSFRIIFKQRKFNQRKYLILALIGLLLNM